uniref:Putative primase n=1 Tax=viral metagenome TaxID=1070528 RepID=A0A6H1ZL03_9ZZZZ
MPTNERNIPDWLTGFMLLTEDSEPPPLFRKWTAVSAIASALQRKCRVSIGISLTFYPNFYIVLVGPSATGKGTAMKYAYDIIEQIPAIKLSSQATSLQALIRRMKDTNLTDIDMATGEQLYHSSLSIFSNEFTVFLGYHNRELIAALCDWYDCHNRWSYDTIKRDKEEVIGVWINILAGTTPDNIQTSLPIEAIGGGLTSRIIFVNEERKNKLVVFPTTTEKELQLQQYLIHDLEQITLMSGEFQFSEDAISFYSDWCHIADKNPPFYSPKFDGYCGRRRNHLLSLSMVCSASRSNEMIITKDDLERSSVMLAEVEIKMGTVFRGIGTSDISSLINDAIIFIENSATPEIPIWQFARQFEGNMDKIILDRIIHTLEAAKYINILKRPGTDSLIQVLGK